MPRTPLEQAKQVATNGLSFRIVEQSGLLPPQDILNTFLARGCDDLPDERVLEWEPSSLTQQEYRDLLAWWQLKQPRARVDRLDVQVAGFSRWFARAIDAIRPNHPL